MPDQNASSLPKTSTKTEVAKLVQHTSWRIGIFLSLPLVIQLSSLSKPTHAENLANSLIKPLNQVKPVLGSLPKQPEPRFFQGIFNLIAFASGSNAPKSLQKSVYPQPVTTVHPALASLEKTEINNISNQPKLYLASEQFSTKPQTLIHQVKPGDTITKIAREYQVSSNELIRLNQIPNANIIFVGQKLQIPIPTAQGGGLASELPVSANATAPQTDAIEPVTTALSAPEDSYIANLRAEIEQLRAQYREERSAQENATSTTPVSLATPQTPTTTKSNLPLPQRNLQSNRLQPDSLALVLPPLPNSEEYLPSTFDGYIWPAEGVLTSGYGWRWGRIHQGIDIAAPLGTPIVAAASGKVVNVGWHGGYGNLIKLEHLDGSSTIYAHNHRNLVSHGQKVQQGEQIAEMGSTGYSTGPHLHFEIHLRNQEVVDPLALLGSR